MPRVMRVGPVVEVMVKPRMPEAQQPLVKETREAKVVPVARVTIQEVVEALEALVQLEVQAQIRPGAETEVSVCNIQFRGLQLTMVVAVVVPLASIPSLEHLGTVLEVLEVVATRVRLAVQTGRTERQTLEAVVVVVRTFPRAPAEPAGRV